METTTTAVQTVKAGSILIYNDGRSGHTDARCEVLAVSRSGMTVQFDDRADTTAIRFDDDGWMQFLSVVNRPTIAMSAFFALPAVIAQQEIQKRNPYGSQVHRAAHTELVRLADGYLTQGRNELVSCATFFGDY